MLTRASVFLEAAGVEKCTSLRAVVCSGEALSVELQQGFFDRLATLDEQQPFYKLQAQTPIVQGRPLNPLEHKELAKQYVAAMRAVQRE